MQRYAEIDAFSLGKDKARPLRSGQTARVMGKNDLWIAATASVLNTVLLAIDNDFDHLSSVFLDVIISIKHSQLPISDTVSMA